MPTGFVKSMIHAPAAARARTRSAMSSTTGTVRSALREPAGARRLLSDAPAGVRDRLIRETRRLPPDADLDEHEVGAVDGAVEIVRDEQVAAEGLSLQHARRHAADDLAALAVDVVQRELAHVDALALARETGHELGRVGRPGADDRDLHPFTPVSVTPSTKAFWAMKKRPITGSITSSVAAIVRFHCT